MSFFEVYIRFTVSVRRRVATQNLIPPKNYFEQNCSSTRNNSNFEKIEVQRSATENLFIKKVIKKEIRIFTDDFK